MLHKLHPFSLKVNLSVYCFSLSYLKAKMLNFSFKFTITKMQNKLIIKLKSNLKVLLLKINVIIKFNIFIFFSDIVKTLKTTQ